MSKKKQLKKIIHQESKKKKIPQKVNKEKESGRKDIKNIEKHCEKLVMVLSEQSSLGVYLFDMLNQFAYNGNETCETDSDKLNKLFSGIKALNKYRRDTLTKVIQLSAFRGRIRELYDLLSKKDFFNEKFLQLSSEIASFINTSIDVLDGLKEFWELYKQELFNSQIPENFVLKIMSVLNLSKEEIDEFIEYRKNVKPVEVSDKGDTSELFEEEIKVDPEDDANEEEYKKRLENNHEVLKNKIDESIEEISNVSEVMEEYSDHLEDGDKEEENK